MLKTSFEWGLIFSDSQMRCCLPGAGRPPQRDREKRSWKKWKGTLAKIQVFFAAERQASQNQRLGWKLKWKHKHKKGAKTHKFELVVNTRWRISKLLIIGNVKHQRLWLCLQTGGGHAYLHHHDFFLEHPASKFLIWKYFHRLIAYFWSFYCSLGNLCNTQVAGFFH